MSELSQIVEQIKQATDYQINRKLLREKILADLHVPYNNGMFKISPELIGFLSTWPHDDLYLEDIYQNPIQIRREELLGLAQQQYQKVMNYWHQEHAQLKSIRKI